MKGLDRIQGEKKDQADRHPIILYGEIHSITERMFQSAKRGDWDAVTSLEENRQRLLEGVTGVEENRSIDHAEVEGQADWIRNILSLDIQIKELLTKKMFKLRKEFDGAKKLVGAYGVH